MEQEKILSTIKEQLGQTSLSDRTLTTYVEKIAPSEGEPDDAFFATHVEILKSLGGQYNHDVATSVEDFKKNYKPETPHQETPKPQETPADDEKTSELEKRLAALEGELKSERAKLATRNLRSEVLEKSKSLKIAKQGLFRDCVENVEIKDGQTADEILASAKALYEQKFALYGFGDEAQPFESAVGGGGNDKSKSVSDYFAAKARKEGWGKK